MQIDSDALPAKLLLLDHETEDEDKLLTIIFSGCPAEKSATILTDNGASRNFIARKFMHRHQIVTDSEEVAEVLLGDASSQQVSSQFNVNVRMNVQDNVPQQRYLLLSYLQSLTLS